jgi:hypothetical protein
MVRRTLLDAADGLSVDETRAMLVVVRDVADEIEEGLET